MAKVNIQYSRKDVEFTRRLTTALEKNGLDCWVDWEDIPPSVDWSKEIEKGIEEADALIFILSPDAARSKVNMMAIDIAVKNGKQIIPVVVRDVDGNDVIPPHIAQRNWIYMRENDDFDRGVNTIMTAINTDYEWLAAHSRLQVKALEWKRSNKDESFLLRGKALQDAELQLSVNASKDPRPTELQFEYIQSSRKGAASILSRGVEFVSNAIGGGRNSDPNSEINKVVPNAPISQSTLDAGVAAQNTEAESQSKETPALTAEQIAERAARLQIAIAANMLANNRSQAVFNDKAEGEDQLGIKDEVEALAETLLLRDVEPPVAVGILGGWGSGKSFVMYLISQYVQSTRAKPVKKGWGDKDKEKDPDVPAFVGHIYQINFNAWTYAKSNLWASLMDTIFSSLNRQMQLERLLAHREYSAQDNPPSKADIQAKMLAGDDEFKKIYLETPQIDQVKGLEKWKENLAYWGQRLLKDTLLWNVMRGQQVETLDKLKDTEEQLLQLKNRREKFEEDHAPNEIVANDLDNTGRLAYLQSIKNFTLAFLSDALSKTAREELKKQDVKDADVQKFLKEATGFWGGLKTIIAAFRRSKLYLLWAIIFLALSIFLPRFWAAYAEKPVQYYMAQGVSIFLAILPVAKVLYAWAVKFVNLSQEANKILEGSFAAQQAKDAEKIISSTDMSLPKKIAELQVDISKGSLAAYDALIGLLEAQAVEQRQKIGSSAKYSNLMEFVQSRLDAATYENQLGLMHQVRKDIDELTFSLVDNADEDIFPRGKPRVILYIDDLDRCPPPRVVEVLEAVQLLLSTKLFIVILGLDTRYVTRALEKEYKEILQHEGDPSGLDYIEKIIQIPYRVRPIDADNLRKYIEKQMDIEKAAETELGSKQPPAQTQSTEGVTPKPEVNGPAQVPTDTLKSGAVKTGQKEEIKSTPQSEPKPKDLKPLEVDLPAAVIQFKQEDLDDLAACCQKIPLTPRSIKRLVNVFKLMKIFWFRADKNAGLAERDRPRSVKQAAICLLALSSAYPEVMREVFVHLDTLYREGQEQIELFTALNNIKLPLGSAHELSWQLHKYKTDLGILNTIAGVEQKKFGQVTLQELRASTFNIVRSFSFVGDPLYWTDGDEDAAYSKETGAKNISTSEIAA